MSQIATSVTTLSAGLAAGPVGRVLFIDADLMLYAGYHGWPSTRTIGALTLYFAVDKPLHFGVDDAPPWECAVAVAPPYVPHRVSAAGTPMYGVLMIEPECMDMAAVRGMLTAAALDRLGVRIRELVARLGRPGAKADFFPGGLESALFAAPLPRKPVDARVWKVVDRIRRQPGENFTARDCAALAALSPSRFIHLFNDELGVSFRAFRAWKRARSFLNLLTREANLTRVALDMGYPDASYFSHTIRRVYGLKPKDIFAGARYLTHFGEAQQLSR